MGMMPQHQIFSMPHKAKTPIAFDPTKVSADKKMASGIGSPPTTRKKNNKRSSLSY
jgi:hypothetical protein